MSIRPHPTHAGWYVVDYYPNGRHGKRERIPFPSYAAAAAFENSIRRPDEQPARIVHPRLRDIIDEHLEWVHKHKSATTWRNKEQRFRLHIIPALGHHRARDLSHRLLEQYKAHHTRDNGNNDAGHIAALLRWMVKNGYAEPLTWKIDIHDHQRTIKAIPDPDDVRLFIEALPREIYRIAAWWIIYTGMRPGELKHLRWERYRRDAIIVDKTKTRQAYTEPIPEPLRQWFRDHRQEHGYIFSVTGGSRPFSSKMLRPFQLARQRTGLDITPHLLRHASATFLYEQTSDIYAVQHHLRHSRPSTSQIYTRYSATRRQKAVNILVDYMDNTHNPTLPNDYE